MDVADLERRSGWRVEHHAVLGSTNDRAAALADAGAAPRTAVVADAQTAGRGRAGRSFASPAGGLYTSLLLEVPAQDVPAAVVALVAVAGAEAVEAVTGAACGIKWPNDLWIERRKVGGILLETQGVPGRVVAGLGINVDAVPGELPAALQPHVAALAGHAAAAPARAELLAALLASLDAWQARRREAGGLEALEDAWRGRLALRGEVVTCMHAGTPLEGVLEDASLDRGLLLRDALSGPVWRCAEHVHDLRPVGRTI